jgi:N-acetylmuramoyl-L-alanine amidase
VTFGGAHLAASFAAGSSAGQPVDPSLFSPTACLAYAPTVGDSNQTVFLDAGHGGVDPGAVGTTRSGRTITESAETLHVELDALSLLRADGYRVVVSRTTNSSVVRLRRRDLSGGVLSLRGVLDDVGARDVCANAAGANLLVGIYFDASSSPSTAGALTAYDPARPFASANHRLARLVQHDVLAALDAHGWRIPNDGVSSDSQLGSSPGNPAAGGLAALSAAYNHLLLLGPAEKGYFTTPSEMPGALVEPLYITDPFEGSIAASPAGQRAIAAGIARAVEQDLPPSTTTTSTTTSTTSTSSTGPNAGGTAPP